MYPHFPHLKLSLPTIYLKNTGNDIIKQNQLNLCNSLNITQTCKCMPQIQIKMLKYAKLVIYKKSFQQEFEKPQVSFPYSSEWKKDQSNLNQLHGSSIIFVFLRKKYISIHYICLSTSSTSSQSFVQRPHYRQIVQIDYLTSGKTVIIPEEINQKNFNSLNKQYQVRCRSRFQMHSTSQLKNKLDFVQSYIFKSREFCFLDNLQGKVQEEK
ncbi:unnamed protein product [Paramecium sonneborni]|uniref:Uncharacterized protein n=1 Tax=Paramecium sonneborni TaxID=65129 RepID=A0A8S1QBM4_9CILI|nr:unnamed protein product [Paramecium sonneborni]